MGVDAVAITMATYETASQGMIFSAVALAFVGMGLSLALMLRPKTCAMCIWSMAVFSLAWLIESTTHLLGVGGHLVTDTLKYGVWAAVGLFGLGFLLGVLGVLAYVRNEHKYERGLVIGVFATLLNLWVVGGIVKALRGDQVAVIGRGLVIPVMSSGGPIDEHAIFLAVAKLSERELEERALKMSALLGRVAADIANGLTSDRGLVWELDVAEAHRRAKEEAAQVALRAIHPHSQHRLSLTTQPGWMSLSLSPAPSGADPAAVVAGRADESFEKQLLSLMPQRRLRAERTHLGGFEIIHTSTHASIKGVTGALVFDRWVASGGALALEVWACSPDEGPGFLAASRDFVTGVLRRLQRDGLTPPKYSPAIIAQRERAVDRERAEEIDDALALWKHAAHDTPQDPEVLLGVVRCAWKLGEVREAVTWLEGIPIPPGEPVSARLSRCRLLSVSGNLDARQALITSFEGNVADDDALAALLLSLVTANEHGGAIEALTAYGPQHAAPLVAWWHAFLTSPAAAPAAASTRPAGLQPDDASPAVPTPAPASAAAPAAR